MSASRLAPDLIALLRADLGRVADLTVAAVRQQVPAYAGTLRGEMATNIVSAVQMALAGFLRLAAEGVAVDPGTPRSPAVEGAYQLGQGEARSGRAADALLAAYRIGARVAWRELSATALRHDVDAEGLAFFAELVFAYIDSLSGASLAGHADEMASAGRVRERRLERLTRELLAGSPEETVEMLAERADWRPPATLTAVLVPEVQLRAVGNLLPSETLELGGDLPGPAVQDPEAGHFGCLLVPELDEPGRRRLAVALEGRGGVIGPARPWSRVRASYGRALRGWALRGGDAEAVLDTDARLVDLVLGADPEALADLRSRVLAPMDRLRPASREKLSETLRSWLLHQGRRDDVAADLFVHPQTVRYRLGQLRELFGDRLEDPATVLELTLALG